MLSEYKLGAQGEIAKAQFPSTSQDEALTTMLVLPGDIYSSPKTHPKLVMDGGSPKPSCLRG